MLEIIERDGKKYCQEDGCEWVYIPTVMPIISVDAKIEELNAACNATILSGFTSDALGSENHYDFDTDDQINLGGMLNAVTANLVSGTIYWKASDIPQPHTVEQFKQVFADGLNWKNNNIGRYWELKSRVLSGEPLDGIVW